MDGVTIIGGGPAGLKVLQDLSKAGIKAQLFEQKKSVGRKFLIAGKSGLNLTNAAEQAELLSHYQGKNFPHLQWQEMYKHFGNQELQAWSARLKQPTFVSSGNKVFPQGFKAAQLLTEWLKEIKANKGQILTNHTLSDIQETTKGYEITFQTPTGLTSYISKTVVLALGGASWPQTGSNGNWNSLFIKKGIQVEPFQPANCGWEINWDTKFLAKHEGTPLKNIHCTVNDNTRKGELIITKYGLEGGPLYHLTPFIRNLFPHRLTIDFKPDLSQETLERKAESVKKNLSDALKERWKLPEAVISLLNKKEPEIFNKAKVKSQDLSLIAQTLKHYNLPLTNSRPLTESISTAGGVSWNEVDQNLMLKNLPNLYLCGEMLDWEAPTGGFLLQGCFTTASWVSNHLITHITHSRKLPHLPQKP